MPSKTLAQSRRAARKCSSAAAQRKPGNAANPGGAPGHGTWDEQQSRPASHVPSPSPERTPLDRGKFPVSLPLLCSGSPETPRNVATALRRRERPPERINWKLKTRNFYKMETNRTRSLLAVALCAAAFLAPCAIAGT